MDRQDVLDEKRNVTGQLSHICRFIGFGLLAAFYTIFTDTAGFSKLIESHWHLKWLLFAVGAAGSLVVLFDFLQYRFGAISVEEALKATPHEYNEDSFAYKWRKYCFNLKQLFVAIGCAVLVLFILSTFFVQTLTPAVGAP